MVGTAFDYLARFRIARFLKRNDVIQGWAAFEGFKQLAMPDNHKNVKLFFSWVDKILEYVNDSSITTTELLEIAVHLAKLEQIARNKTLLENADFAYLFDEAASKDIITDLGNLMAVFEDSFMRPEILTKKSEVFFNPSFGIGSALVDGADADLFIDGTLYDFKTTKNKSLAQKDNLQMIGYFILRELSKECEQIVGIGNNENMDINRISFYKARFGEIEYYDVGKFLSFMENEILELKLKETAAYFKKYLGSLRKVYLYDYDDIKQELDDISNWDMDEIVSRIIRVKKNKMSKKSSEK